MLRDLGYIGNPKPVTMRFALAPSVFALLIAACGYISTAEAIATSADTAGVAVDTSKAIELASQSQGIAPDCYEVVKETRLESGTVIVRSKNPMVFEIEENLNGELQFSKTGLPFYMSMNLYFSDDMYIDADFGEQLTISFADGYTTDILPSGRQISIGSRTFTICNSDTKGGEFFIDDSYRIMFEHFKSVDVSYFKCFVNSRIRQIPVDKDKAAIIRRIVNCLQVE